MPLTNDAHCSPCDLLEEPEHDVIFRLTRLVQHLFSVPIAYMALLGSDLNVLTRIGSGKQYWDYLRTYPLARSLARPMVWPDPSGTPASGFNPGELKFAASAPLRSSDGLELGLLVIADTQARPHFSERDVETFAELAGVLAGKMELRMMVSQARETELSLKEAERRFRNIADAAPVLIIYSGIDGSSSFVNKTWLDFTGRNLEDEIGEGYLDVFHPDYRESVMEKYWDAFQSRNPHAQEFPMRRHDGEYRWMVARGMPRFHDDGAFAGYIACLVDVTGQRPLTTGEKPSDQRQN
jgi:PAS domain S-box-containing protein